MLSGICESINKVLHTGEALTWIFSQRPLYDLFDSRRYTICLQRRWCHSQVLHGDFNGRPSKRRRSTEPFIHRDSKSVLIAGRLCMTLELLWGKVARSSCHLFYRRVSTIWLSVRCKDCQAEVTELYLAVCSKEHILRLHIAMDDVPIMSI